MSFWRWMESVKQDAWHGLRLISTTPGLTVTTVLTVALGIGTSSAMFSLMNSVLMKRLPYPNAERLAAVEWRFDGGVNRATSEAGFFWLRDHVRAFQWLAAYELSASGQNLLGFGHPVYVQTLRVSRELFPALGIQPILGRAFQTREDIPGGPASAVISNSLWRGMFRSDPGIIGGRVNLNDRAYTVIGVLPPNFSFSREVDVWLPLQLRDDISQAANNYAVIAALRPTVSVAAAAEEATANWNLFRRTIPPTGDTLFRQVKLLDYRSFLVGPIRVPILVACGAATLLLLISVINVSGLMLSRSYAREDEIAIRLAVGVGLSRLAQQLIVEALQVALIGGLTGLVLARFALRMFLSWKLVDLPRYSEIRVDGQSLIFAACISIGSALVFSIIPISRGMRVQIATLLGSSSRRAGKRGTTLGRWLVSGQVAITLVLLAAAVLLCESFLRLRSVAWGFEPSGVTTLKVALTSSRYRSTGRVWMFTRDVLQRLTAIPGVVSAASISSLATETGLNIPMQIEGYGPKGFDSSIEYRAVSPDYFRAMRVPIRTGRSFTEADTAGSKAVALINDSMARRYWPNLRQLGNYISLAKGMGALSEPPREIVGVVGDTRELEPAQPPPPVVFVPLAQVPDALTEILSAAFLRPFVLRTDSRKIDGGKLFAAISDVDPSLPLAKVESMDNVLAHANATPQLHASLIATFAGCALFLTAVGLYGLLSFQVKTQTREIGVRMAVGATPNEVFRLIVSRALEVTAIGVAAGILMAILLMRFAATMMFQVRPTDPVVLAATALSLMITAFVSSILPAWRALKIEPVVKLR